MTFRMLCHTIILTADAWSVRNESPDSQYKNSYFRDIPHSKCVRSVLKMRFARIQNADKPQGSNIFLLIFTSIIINNQLKLPLKNENKA